MRQIDVVGAIIIDKGNVLCCKRPKGKSLGGYWEFPGGKIEKSETAIDALKREIQEELSCDIKIKKNFEVTSYVYDFGQVNLHTFICELIKGEPTLLEHEEMVWLPVHQLNTLTWAPADIPAVDRLIRETKSYGG